MNHQDWNPIVLNSISDKKNKTTNKEIESEKSKFVPAPETIKLVPTSNIGLAIANARNIKNKTQTILAGELGISQTVLGRWENNKETPTNAQVAQIERKLAIKLPRSKIVKQQSD
jgi:ribosome-binding protein aMBF1 (putative translation factor)